MAKEKDEEGAKFVRYFGPLLDALRGLGGSAKADEAVDRVAEDLKLPDNVLDEVLPSEGGRAFEIRSRGRGFISCERDSWTPPNTGSGALPTRDSKRTLRVSNRDRSFTSG